MFKQKTSFDFLSLAKTLTPLSIVLSFVALTLVLILGFTYGIDFAGGNEVHARFEKNVTAGKIRETLKKAGILNPIVQEIGNTGFITKDSNSSNSITDIKDIKKETVSNNKSKEFLIRIEVMKNEQENNAKLETLQKTLTESFQKVSVLRVDSVGPQIGKELRQKGLLAVFYSLLMILIYLGIRFDSRYAPSAVFCLFHDTVITLSIFSLFNLEVSVQTLAAILAIIGYSLNDTIVTFDRIRENQNLFSSKKSFYDICNQSLNDVISRTLLTSVTTLLAVGAMWYFTDGVIKDFAFTLALGVVIGTYSSLFVATPLLFSMSRLSFFNRNPVSR